MLEVVLSERPELSGRPGNVYKDQGTEGGNPDFSFREHLLKAGEDILATVQTDYFSGKKMLHSTYWKTNLSGVDAYNALFEFSNSFEGSPNYVVLEREGKVSSIQFKKFQELQFNPADIDSGKCTLFRLTGLMPDYGTDIAVDKRSDQVRLAAFSVYNMADLIALFIMKTVPLANKTSEEVAAALNNLYSGLVPRFPGSSRF